MPVTDLQSPCLEETACGESLSNHSLENLEKNDSSKDFTAVYDQWLKTRKGTIEKLTALLEKLHHDQKRYNKIQMACRKTSQLSRQAKSSVQSQPLDFLASFAAVLCDSSCGVASLAQAVNIETYQEEFNTIMDHDAKVTKQLYDARSRCCVEYNGIEEVFRKFHFDTLNSAVSKVSDTLEVDKFVTDFERALRSNDENRISRIVQGFVTRNTQSEVLSDVNNSIGRYLNNNPAASEACKAFQRVVLGVSGALGIDRNYEIDNRPGCSLNDFLMNQDETDLSVLRSTVDRNSAQSKLEEKILDSVDSLTQEMDEINEAYLQLHFHDVGNDSVLE